MKRPTDIKLEGDAERVRLDHAQVLREIQSAPCISEKVVSGVSLANGVATQVAHSLGKTPSWVGPSIVRGATSAGYIVETRPVGVDRTKFITLTANGYGATIIVDLRVVP